MIVIAGPTASGKSALGLAVARQFNGRIINADSMQVYGVLRILTARPTPEDEAAVEHRLYGFMPPDQICTAALWRDHAATEITHAIADGKVPVIVGGTGLYLRTLMEGISPVPDIPAEIRADTRARLDSLGNAAFHALLAEKDPVMAARLGPSNTQRLARAWEVWAATGRSLADWQTEPNQGAYPARWLTIVLDPPRAELAAAAESRFRRMIDHGALDEARAIAALHLAADCPALKALGLPELMAYCNGTRDLNQAITQAVQATRQYAKRQSTWFRHQIKTENLYPEKFSESLLDKIFSIVRHFLLTPA